MGVVFICSVKEGKDQERGKREGEEDDKRVLRRRNRFERRDQEDESPGSLF